MLIQLGDIPLKVKYLALLLLIELFELLKFSHLAAQFTDLLFIALLQGAILLLNDLTLKIEMR